MAETSLPGLLIRLWRNLSRRRQFQLGILLGIMVLTALCEMISLGAVLPFIGILTSPETMFNYPIVRDFALRLGISSPGQLILPITILFVVAAIVAGATRLLMLWLSQRLAFAMGTDLSIEIYRKTLHQPYRMHVARNSSELISGITSKTWTVIETIQSLLATFSSAAIAVCLVVVLLAVEPMVMSIAASFIGACYSVIAWSCRKRVKSNSGVIATESTQIVKALQEGLGGIRDVLLSGSQEVYTETYRKADVPLRHAYASNRFLATGPRFAMEAVGMSLIAVLAYGMSLQSGGVSTALPVLATLALGAQRLLPVIQLMYNNLISILGSRYSLENALDLLEQNMSRNACNFSIKPLEFKKTIDLVGVKFRYVDEGDWILKDINLRILYGSRIGFVGPTGSGKSTLLDIIMALLEPNEGGLFVDGIEINQSNRQSWQKCIAHVPQSIFLADTTIAENIAFGIPKDQIDMSKVKSAAEQARVAEFIENRPKGYQASIGERGIRLSGGQRQRIGIARALYRQPKLLILDEATSSLDNSTELEVMRSIAHLNRGVTILIIAHRITTLHSCDEIVQIKKCKKPQICTYADLVMKHRNVLEISQS